MSLARPAKHAAARARDIETTTGDISAADTAAHACTRMHVRTGNRRRAICRLEADGVPRARRNLPACHRGGARRYPARIFRLARLISPNGIKCIRYF
ncbi:hypothetical protein ACGYT9_21595 [Burkholderia pseudomallei]|uniref:hypothetical protein n=1 Tax=Burkholderia pseudomallei TaxID=28450 RepID=UPI00016AD88E|nr:hypothetical protein [Burkholderia pseudomallei]ARK51216.1 hypothetical protein BOC35_35635 [Burkholderia pseudomallei]ARK51917.1 hypothetical protein BOC36_01040 [Burkholderia pseudomallei]ARK68818.1 hypothetical protein BOC38_20600 [Burkholderia pseudomallei]ARK78142.1 hypothetical protein BOC39_33500 [Burkholderia pseudomallei]ARK80857.1 hypothetical protein BOC40_10910 [Burkholderia pseudomallei]